MKGKLHTFDDSLTKLVGRIPESFEHYFRWLGRLTTPLLWVSGFTIVHAFFLTPGALSSAVIIVVLLLPVATIMKLFFRRKRPPTIYAATMRVKSYSFPSSHAYSAALAGGYLACEAARADVLVLTLLLGTLVLVIGLSRVRIGAHYPSDVVAGWGLGFVALAAVLILVK